MTFSTIDHRRKKQYLFSGISMNNKVHDLLVRELNHRLAGKIRISNTRTGKKKTQEVIDFCDRADCGTWVLGRGLLINGNNRTQTGNFIHVRTLNLADKTPCIGRERFHVPALTFRKDSIESKRRLTRTA